MRRRGVVFYIALYFQENTDLQTSGMKQVHQPQKNKALQIRISCMQDMDILSAQLLD